MEMNFYHVIQFIVVGIGGGIMGGFFGVGAAIIMVPLLIFWVFPSLHVQAGIIVQLAFGTSLAIVIPTALTSSLAHSRAGNVSWKIVCYAVVTGLAGSYLGSTLAARMNGTLLKSLFALLLTTVAIQMFVQKKDREAEAFQTSAGIIPALGLGLVVGLFSGFFGVGGGVIAIPLMVRFMGIPIHRSMGTSTSFVFFVSLVGTAGYIINGWGKIGLPPYSLGYVHAWGWILAGIPSIFFAKWGTGWARRTKPQRLQQAFAILLAVSGLRMLWDALRLFLA